MAGHIFTVMKIRLKTNIGVLGNKGETVEVGKRLAQGLIRRRRAELVTNTAPDVSTNYTATEAAQMVSNMDSKEAKAFTKGETRKTVLIELKEEPQTKEEKAEYKTK